MQLPRIEKNHIQLNRKGGKKRTHATDASSKS